MARDPIALSKRELARLGFVDGERDRGDSRGRRARRSPTASTSRRQAPRPVDAARDVDRAVTSIRERATPLHGRDASRELSYAQAIQEAHGDRHGSRRTRLPDGRGHRRLWRRLPGDRRPRRSASATTGSWTRRSPSSAARASRSARRSPACGRSSSSSSPTSPTLAMEQIVNQAAKIRFMLGGAVSVPLVMRLPAGSGTGAAAQHSQSLEAWFAHVPGLKVVQPATPHDAKGMLLAAIDDPDPVMVFEHKLLYKMKGPVPEGHYTVPHRQGATSAAKAATSRSSPPRSWCIARSTPPRTLAQRRHRRRRSSIFARCGRSTRDASSHSVKKTHAAARLRLRRREDARHRRRDQRHASPRATLSTISTRRSCGSAAPNAPIPYNPELEKAAVPQTPTSSRAARDLVSGGSLSHAGRSHPAAGRHGHDDGRSRAGMSRKARRHQGRSRSSRSRPTRPRWKSRRRRPA